MNGSDDDRDRSFPGTPDERVDVLVLTALKDELDALLGLGQTWTEERDAKGFRSSRCTLANGLNVVAAWIGEMGQTSAAARGQALIHELSPECLAMCGICAGDPEKVSLGDVVVANALWPYDEGKQTEAGFYHSLKMFHTERVWSMDAAFADWIDLNMLAQGRPPTKEAQTRWLLHTLYAHHFDGGPAPAEHPARKALCPDYAKVLKDAIAGAFVVRQGRSLTLTDAGKDCVDEDLALHPDGVPSDPALRIHIGAMATGSAVMEDPGIFRRLRRVKRETIALDMEGAAIAELADRAGKRFLVMKAVQDFANGHKDDTFRPFGCRASAMCLLAFLEKHLEPKRETIEPHDDPRGFDRERERENPFVGRVERAAALRHPKAKITRRHVDVPFAGLLEVQIDEGFLDSGIVVALDSAITPEILSKFFRDIEQPFRKQDPSRRLTLVHRGDFTPQAMQAEASRRRMTIKTFHEYQGMFDMKPYLEWLKKRLVENADYAPHMYVDAPAEYQLVDSREWHQLDNAANHLLTLLNSSDQRGFALILGDFGAGKTFLLREVVRRMIADNHPVWPVFVELSSLEKNHDLPALLGAHFAEAGVPGYDFRTFQYMLNEGRLALLFDGFDEWAHHATYDMVPNRFNAILSATQGDQAKVVLSSRRQHFMSESEVKLVLTEQAQHLSGFQLVLLRPFEEVHIRQFLRNALADEQAAHERYALINDVKDLRGLSQNPRMLGFIAKISPTQLREARLRKQAVLTAADVYELLVKERWLKFEHARQRKSWQKDAISLEALDKGVTAMALWMWQSQVNDVRMDQVQQKLSEAMRALHEAGLDRSVLTHLFLSGSLLVRDADGAFSFIHVSVMEWLVAREAAADQRRIAKPTMILDAREMTVLIADFFVDTIGRDEAVKWVRAKASTQDNRIVARNVALVRTEIENRWGTSAFEGNDIPIVHDFAGQDFRGRDLKGKDWRWADLRWANLEGVLLIGANLSGANLADARLGGANLTRANLTGARLERADLRQAMLTHARMNTANLMFANLVLADLQDAVGLDSTERYRTNMAGALVTDKVVSVLDNALGTSPWVQQAEPMCPATAAQCQSVAFNHVGDLLATGFTDGMVCLFDTVKGEMLRVLVGHSKAVTSLAFHPNSKTLASASEDNTIRLWDIGTGRTDRLLDGHSDLVSSVAFSPDGKTIASGSVDKTVRLWDAASGRMQHILQEHEKSILGVAFSPDGDTVASCSVDRTIRIWDTKSAYCLCTLKGHSDAVTGVAFSPDGKTIATCSDDKTVRIWDVASEREIRTLKGHFHPVASVAFSPDGNTIASGSRDKTLRIWNTTSGRSLRTLEGHSDNVKSVAFCPDGTMVASGSMDQTVRLWDTTTGRESTLRGHIYSTLSVAWSPDGKTFVFSAADKALRISNVLMDHSMRVLEGHTDVVYGLSFSPDGNTMVSGSNDRTLRCWDVASGRATRVLEGHTDVVYSVAVSPDGNTVVSGSCDKTLRFWDMSTGQTVHIFEGHGDWVHSVAFGPDGKTIASGSRDKTVRLWNAALGTTIRVLEGHTNAVTSIVFSPDGKTIASGSRDKTVRLWDTASGRSMRLLEEHTDAVYSVAFSVDGKTIASSSRDNTARIWDAVSGRAIRVLEGHTAGVTSVAFSPDGQTIASASRDGTIRLWDVVTGQCHAILFASPEGWVAFSADGRYKYGGNLAGSFWHIVGLCRFEVGELDLQLPDDADFRKLPPLPSPIRCKEVSMRPRTDIRFLDGAGIRYQPTGSVGAPHREHWLSRLSPSPHHALLTRFAEWIELCHEYPAIKPHTRHADFADRPARISLIGETFLRASSAALGLDDVSLDALCADFVASAYTLQLDRAISVVLSTEDVSQDLRAKLAQLLNLPWDSANTAIDYFQRLARLIPAYALLPESDRKQPPRGLSLAGLATDVWKLPARIGDALIAATCPTLAPLVRITPENPLPGLFVLCKALQLWQRPRIIASERLVELHELIIEGLEDPQPGKRPGFREKLVFRFDWRGKDTTLAKTAFDDRVVRSTMHAALDRLRIAADGFPDIRVELLFPKGTENLEIIREAAAPRPVAIASSNAIPAKPSTWAELSALLETAPDIDILARLRTVFKTLPHEDAIAAEDLLIRLVGRIEIIDEVRLDAAEFLSARIYYEPTDERRTVIADALLAFATPPDLRDKTRHRAFENLLEIFAALPVASMARVANAIRDADAQGALPSALKPRITAIFRRHARFLEAPKAPLFSSKSRNDH